MRCLFVFFGCFVCVPFVLSSCLFRFVPFFAVCFVRVPSVLCSSFVSFVSLSFVPFVSLRFLFVRDEVAGVFASTVLQAKHEVAT